MFCNTGKTSVSFVGVQGPSVSGVEYLLKESWAGVATGALNIQLADNLAYRCVSHLQYNVGLGA